jgi:hypothetical protein
MKDAEPAPTEARRKLFLGRLRGAQDMQRWAGQEIAAWIEALDKLDEEDRAAGRPAAGRG